MSREVHREIIGHLGTKESGMELEIHTPLGKLIVQTTESGIVILTTQLDGPIRTQTTSMDDRGSIGTLTIERDL